MDKYNLISLIISALALVFSLYSIIKTNIFNRYELLVEDAHCEHFGEYQRVYISIFNNSNKSIKINNIDFYISKNLVHPVDLNIYEYYEKIRLKKMENREKPKKTILGVELPNSNYNNQLLATVLPEPYEFASETESLIIPPNQREKLTLYFCEYTTELTMKIYANQKISLFGRKKSFPIFFDNIN